MEMEGSGWRTTPRAAALIKCNWIKSTRAGNVQMQRIQDTTATVQDSVVALGSHDLLSVVVLHGWMGQLRKGQQGDRERGGGVAYQEAGTQYYAER